MEGAIAHFLACDKIIVLRCRPDVLKDRLSRRGYSAGKVAENCQAEALDVILSETADMFASEHVYEIDTTNRAVISVADLIVSFAADEIPASYVPIDWSEYRASVLCRLTRTVAPSPLLLLRWPSLMPHCM